MPTTHSPVVIRFGRLGDTVLLQPLLHKLHLRYGQPCRLLALGDWPAQLYSAEPEVGGFIPLDSQYGALWFSPRRLRASFALRKLRESPFYIAEPLLRTRTKIRPMLSLAGIPPAHCQFIEDVPGVDGEHWVDWLLRLGDTTPPAFVDAFGSVRAPVVAAPQLHVSDAERADGEGWLREQDMHGRPLVLLQPANKRTIRWNGVRHADDDSKSWPVECWAHLAQAIARQLPEAQVLFCGSDAEAGYLKQVLAATDTGTYRISAAGMPLGRLKALLEIAHSMVSVDTGPAHLAAAVGCPLVVLFGDRRPSTWVPRSGSGSAVAVVGGLPEVTRVDQISLAQVFTTWSAMQVDAETGVAASA